jgi:tight adherence protein B
VSAVAAAVAASASAALLVVGAGRLVTARTPSASAPGGPRRGPIGRRPAGRRLAARLRRAGVPLGPDAFAASDLAAALGAGLATWALLGLAPLAIAAAGAVIGAAAAVVGSADRRHLERVEAQLPGVAVQLAAGLAAGLSLRQALTRAARDAPEPVREELAQVVRELELGGRVESVLEGAVERLPAHDLRIMVTAILVQRRTGGNLARALATLADRLEERGRLARELRGATAQARMTAWLVAALPVGGGVMAEIAAPGTLARVLGSGPGPALLSGCALLYALGVVLIRRIGRVEP